MVGSFSHVYFSRRLAVASVCALPALWDFGAGAAAQPVQPNVLQDVQIGESGAIMRIALVCSRFCDISTDGEGYFLAGVDVSLEIDLSERSRLANAIIFKPNGAGSRLSIGGPSTPIRRAIKDCVAGDAPAACIDLEFPLSVLIAPTASIQESDSAGNIAAAPSTPAFAQRAEASRPQLKEPPARRAPKTVESGAAVPVEKAPQVAPPTLALVRPAIDEPVIAEASATAGTSASTLQNQRRPALREAPGRERLMLAKFEAPERFQPPADDVFVSDYEKIVEKAVDDTIGDAITDDAFFNHSDNALTEEIYNDPEERFVEPHIEQASLTNISPPFSAPRPSIIRRDRAAALLGPDFDFAEQAKKILDKNLDVGACEGAKARLRDDAWALDSMIDAGLCKAAQGDLEAAESDLKRLLSYTPDNYEALVGRALIAAQAGEKSVARKYFQDALNALPPIEESNRIVEAMNAL